MPSLKGKDNPNYKSGRYFDKKENICPVCKKVFLDLVGRKRTTCSRVCNAKLTIKLHPEKYKGWKNMRGYIYLYLPEHKNANSDGYYAQHRYIMEQHIGRTLNKREIVHHLNGIKNDNRIENLELLSSSKEHYRIHRKSLRKSNDEYWSPENRKKQSEYVKEIRKTKYWSSH